MAELDLLPLVLSYFGNSDCVGGPKLKDCIR